MITRPKSERVILGDAVRTALFPVVRGLGFEQIGKGNSFQRSRGSEHDQLEFWWDKYNRPRFLIQFTTTEKARLDALRGDYPTAHLFRDARAYYRRSWMKKLLGGEPTWFSMPTLARLTGRKKALDDLMHEGEQRLREIDVFLKLGQRSPLIKLGI